MWWLTHLQDVYLNKAYPIQAVATINEIVLTDEQYKTIG